LSSETKIRQLGRVEYARTLQRMSDFTDTRNADTCDEIWCLEHPPVFTLGLNADKAHVLKPDRIPVVQVDRGGQVTYHGPGQLIVYTLLDLRRRHLGIRDLVCALENAVIETVAEFGIEAIGRRDAPGVYVNGAKLASIGLRVRRGCSYHGLSVNVKMDLEPFERINPCGFSDLPVTQLSALGKPCSPEEFAKQLMPNLLRGLN
jgi:lipoyl(octanoyl) transferase